MNSILKSLFFLSDCLFFCNDILSFSSDNQPFFIFIVIYVYFGIKNISSIIYLSFSLVLHDADFNIERHLKLDKLGCEMPSEAVGVYDY
jgi:hypothetical protein